MTYHPKQIMMCALFLATKTDHYHISLSRFISKLPKTTEDDIKAPEFLLMQGLRFTLDVRHPMKGLEGGFMELRAMAEGSSTGPDFVRLMQERPTRESILRKRIDAAEYYARKTLHTAAQLTDAYFLYTPSQIWLAALMIADEPLATLFLDAKMKFVGLPLEAIRPKVLDTLQSCADLLKSFNSATEESSEDREIKRIGKKLKICQNPEKLDLVEINKAQKREGADGSDAEKTLKKRKLERERLEKDGDIFGGDLKKSDSDIFGAELKR
ncbi:putative cyclin ccl1 [Phaeomoniella chlamydospora]|uniref:Putative cyclin ccl1 n=1 Tax=Phaeomoniella chlamydospora TaxID=158046 RepID=A0A0G2H6P4_PHACM|nr:putative cyclin ccl1 [Phaeomoniella chlamydospora]